MKLIEKKPGQSEQQNMVVVVGLWICAATVMLIIILNVSARQNPFTQPQAEIKKEIKTPKINSHYSKYAHAGYINASQ